MKLQVLIALLVLVGGTASFAEPENENPYETEDADILRAKELFLLQAGSDPAKVSLCGRVACASLRPSELAMATATLGYSAGLVFFFPDSIEKVGHRAQIGLSKIGKWLGNAK